ncbi:unnamed protein product [Arctogadus glacialis]
MLLGIILSKDDIRKIQIESVPETLDEFYSFLKSKLGLEGDFVVQYEDREFDNELCNLMSLSDLPEGKATLKITVKQASESYHTDSTLDTASLSSSASSLSSPTSSASEGISPRHRPWPDAFEIPRFCYDVELQLKRGNEAYQENGTLLNIRKDTKSEILDKLAEAMYSYTTYPSREEYDIVAQSLIKKHPCLREPVSAKGWYCWKFSLKFKMGNYRNKLRAAGCSELQVNRRSSGPKQKTKKAKKAEVNFLPDFPEGRTQNVLEEERLAIMEEMKKKKADMKKVNEIMVSTFSLRRKQIVEEPPVAEVKTKWPALFTEQQIKVEFTQITSADLRGSFFSGLGQHLPRLLQLYRASSFPELKKVLRMLEEDNSNQTKEDVILRGLPYFLREDPSKFLRTAEPTDMEDSMTRGMNVGIVLVKQGEDLLDISVVLEEQIIIIAAISTEH